METNTNKRGGQPENKNATGNKGGKGAGQGNKYAVSTGEFEHIGLADLLDDEEMALFDNEPEPVKELLNTVRVLEIRKRRIMKRLLLAEKKLQDGDFVAETIKTTRGVSGGFDINSTETTSISAVDFFLRLEAALSRVSSQHSKALANLHKMMLDNAAGPDYDLIAQNHAVLAELLQNPGRQRDIRDFEGQEAVDEEN